MKRMLTFISIGLLVTAAGFAQGRGGSGRSSQRGGQGSGQRQVQGQGQRQSQGQSQGQQQRETRVGDSQGEKDRVKATKQQREQIQECSKQADGLRKQLRTMANTPDKKFNGNEARRQMDQIQNQFQFMDREHERLMNGLDPDQQQAFQEQIQNMSRLRQETRSQLQNMNSDLAPANPDAARIRERARETERIMNEWSKQYQALHKDTED